MEPNKKCCVPGCIGSNKIIQFPDPKLQLSRFKTWLSFINVKTVKDEDYNKLFENYKDKYMCDLHFQPVWCKLPNDTTVTVYTVPVLYGPNFWLENNKKIAESIRIARYQKNVLKEKNPISTKNDEVEHERAAKRVKLPDSSESTSNALSTTPVQQHTKPRILRKNNTPLIPVVEIERMDIDTSPVKTATHTDQEKGPKTTESSTRAKLRPRHTSRVSDKPSPTGSRKSKSDSEDKSESEDGTDSDNDYEVERIDTESDDTECELANEDDSDKPQEIEYLDMDQLELDESQLTTTGNAAPVSLRRTTVSQSSLGSQVNTINSVSKTSISQNCTQNNAENVTVPDAGQEVTIPQIFQEYKRPSLFKGNVQQNPVEEIVIPDDDEVANPNTVTKTYSRTHDSVPQKPNGQKLGKFMPVLQIDGKSGKLIIQLSEQNSTTGNVGTPTNPTTKELTQETNQPQDQSSKVAEKNNPSQMPLPTETPLQASELRSLLIKNNITPLVPETATGQKVTAPQLKGDVGIPKEILDQAKILAANSFQNSMDPTKKTNVYVLDSNGSILLKEQLAPQKRASFAAVPAVPMNTVSQQNTVVQKNTVLQRQINQSNEYAVNKINNLEQRVTLSSIQMTKLNLEKQTLRKKLKEASKEITKLKKSHSNLKGRIKILNNLESHPKYQKVLESMPRIARIITALQFRPRVMIKSNRGRRFTEEEKEIAHSLVQECPSTFKYMKRMGFVLPSTKTSKHFQNVESAINRDDAIEKLKMKVKKMPPHFRLCVLLFDEKLISPSNRNKHVVTAVGSEGEETEVTFEADHALIFMVIGIMTRYEEPVSYTFSFGPTNGSDLALQIKGVISDLQAVGYNVLATICDHAENNRTAIETLTKETENECLLTGNTYKNHIFKVNDKEIVALYDPPHLLKGIRNNLISKNLRFKTNKFSTKTAKWEHIQMLLEENPEYKGVRLIPKLTESHVYPTKLGITKVRFASQVFSQAVAVYMGYLAEKEILPPESRDTAELLLFFDSLFDSFNGHSSCAQKKVKPLLSAAKPKSKHHIVWKEALDVFKSMSFLNNGTVVPTTDIQCWIWTIEGYTLLLEKLFTEHQVGSVWMRVLNQDALERLFRTEVNPSPAVRAKNLMKQTKGAPTWFAGEVVTQKVIKAINRINREEKKEGEENIAKQKEKDSEDSAKDKEEDSEDCAQQEKEEDGKNSAKQKIKGDSYSSARLEKEDSIREEKNEDSEVTTELQCLQDMPLL